MLQNGSYMFVLKKETKRLQISQKSQKYKDFSS